MEIARLNPFRETRPAHRRYNTLMDDFFNDTPFFPGTGMAHKNANPVVDIYEEKDALFIEAELPGIEKENVSVDVEGRILTLKGERKSETKEENDNYYRRERTYGSFSRAFSLPESVDTEKIKADFKNGVLKIEVPKSEEEKPKKIAIH